MYFSFKTPIAMDRFYVKSIIITIFFQSAILFTIRTGAHAQSDPLIRIKLSGTIYSDETIIRFKDVTTTSFDFDWDAYKIMSGSTTPSIYTYIGNTNYSINSIPLADSLPIIHLGTKILEDGNYTISFENSDGLHNYVLIDKKLEVEIPIDSSSVYPFTGLVTDAADRFELHYQIADMKRNVAPEKSDAEYESNITSSTGGIVVSFKNVSESSYTIEILGMGGRIFKTITKEIPTSEAYVEYIELLNLSAGNYLVKLTCNNSTSSYHIVVI